MLSKSSNPVEQLLDPVSKLVFDHWLCYAPGSQRDEQINHSAHLCNEHAEQVPVHRLSTLFHSFGTCDVAGCEQPDEYSYDFNGDEQENA